MRDILVAIAKIRRYTAGMDYPTFADDERTVDAVIRNFSVIGEAAGHGSPACFTNPTSAPARACGAGESNGGRRSPLDPPCRFRQWRGDMHR